MSVYQMMAFCRKITEKAKTDYVEVSKLTAEQCKVEGVCPVADENAIIPKHLVTQGQKVDGLHVRR